MPFEASAPDCMGGSDACGNATSKFGLACRACLAVDEDGGARAFHKATPGFFDDTQMLFIRQGFCGMHQGPNPQSPSPKP